VRSGSSSSFPTDRSREADRRRRQRYALDAVRPTNNAGPRDEELELALKALADYDTKMPAPPVGDKEKIARYHVNRIALLRALAKAAKNDDENRL